jgi:lipopolysaccharide transport system ATP-binding protein
MGSITVRSLGKAYKQYPQRWGRLTEWLSLGTAVRHRLKWVLQEISFSVQPGESVGIIGINGAGKSTLLKLITGTAQASSGSIHMTGRVAALLELGIGFHPDFTGRQNAMMAGQLLGIGTAQLAQCMPDIEAFAEIGDYMDQPVRVYSSGMQMRLAFSVATAIRPDILIVDEALSVGDAYFQHKSFDRIRAFREQGTTLLMVSHDKVAIQSICDRAILLNEGRVAMEGPPEAVMDYYNAMLAQRKNSAVHRSERPDGRVQTISGSGEAQIVDIALRNASGQETTEVSVGDNLVLLVRAQVHQQIPDLVLGFMIKDKLGQPIFGTNTYYLNQVIEPAEGGKTYSFSIEFPANLGPGSYSIAVALHSQENHLTRNYEWRDLAVVFSVVNADKANFVGTNWLPISLTIEP